jgi:hypothetical protein
VDLSPRLDSADFVSRSDIGTPLKTLGLLFLGHYVAKFFGQSNRGLKSTAIVHDRSAVRVLVKEYRNERSPDRGMDWARYRKMACCRGQNVPGT